MQYLANVNALTTGKTKSQCLEPVMLPERSFSLFSSQQVKQIPRLRKRRNHTARCGNEPHSKVYEKVVVCWLALRRGHIPM